VVGSCKHGNEHFAFIKGRKFINLMSDYQLLKEDCASYTGRVFENLHQLIKQQEGLISCSSSENVLTN
jgi:hypothetical protein